MHHIKVLDNSTPKRCHFSKHECRVYTSVYVFQVALVKWTESVGLPLVHRDLTTLTLRSPQGKMHTYTVLQIFPFTSESKRMGIIVRVRTPGGLRGVREDLLTLVLNHINFVDLKSFV